MDWDRVALGLLPSQASLAGTNTGSEHRAHGYYSSSDDEGRSSEEDVDTTVNVQTEETRCVCVRACMHVGVCVCVWIECWVNVINACDLPSCFVCVVLCPTVAYVCMSL